MDKEESLRGTLDAALEVALARALTAPRVTPAFHRRLQTALSREHGNEISELRMRLERERQDRLAGLDAQFLRLRQRSLASLVVAAVAAGVAIAAVFPWLQARLGLWAPVPLSSVAAAIVLIVGTGRAETIVPISQGD